MKDGNIDWMDRKFIRVNHRAIEEGLFKQNGTLLKVLIVRLLTMDDNGDCNFPSSYVAKCTHLSLGTVIKAELKIENFGWLSFSRQKIGNKKRKGKDGKWKKNTCRMGSELPNYLKGVFRKDGSQNLVTIVEPTVGKNPVTDKQATNSLKVTNSLVVSSTQQLFEKLYFPLKGERDLVDLGALQKRYGEEDLSNFLRWFKESRNTYEVKSVRLFNNIIPEWVGDGKPLPIPEFIPCEKCDNGYIYTDSKAIECDCHADWELMKRSRNNVL